VWLYIPSQSVPGSADSTLPSSSPALASSLPFLTWRGKPTQRQSLQRAWKKNPWLSRLSGLTRKPSAMQSSALTFAREQAARESTSCLAASPASRTALPASSSAPTIPATSGLRPCEFLRRISRGSSSSKTSLECSATCPQGRSLICDGLGTSCLDRSCLKPRTSELPSAGSDCSSWPTVRNHEVGEYQNQTDGSTQPTLTGVAQDWQSPNTNPATYTGGNAPGYDTLIGQAQKFWPAATASPEAPNLNSNQVNGPTSLGEAAGLWPTATANDDNKTPEAHLAMKQRMGERDGRNL